MDLLELGFTKEEILDRAVETFLRGIRKDMGRDFVDEIESRFEADVKQQIDASIAKVGCEYFNKPVDDYVRSFKFTATDRWGTPTAEPISLTEYFAQRVESFLKDDVDDEGRTAKQCQQQGRSFYNRGSRLVAEIDKRLRHYLENTAKNMLESAMTQVAGGLDAALKSSLQTVLEKLQMNTKLVEKR